MKPVRVYPDSCALIYLVEQHPQWGAAVEKLMCPAQGAWPFLIFSELTRLECRVKPMKEGNAKLLAAFDQLFAATGYETQALDRSVFEFATQLRAQHNLKTPDALHLAAAIASGCEEIWTKDDRLLKAAQGRIRNIALGDA